MSKMLTQYRPNHDPAFDVGSSCYNHGPGEPPYLMLTLSSAPTDAMMPSSVCQIALTEAQAEKVIQELVGWRGKYGKVAVA